MTIQQRLETMTTNVPEAARATPPEEIRAYLMDCRIPKTEAEHWAARRIAELEEQLSAAPLEGQGDQGAVAQAALLPTWDAAALALALEDLSVNAEKVRRMLHRDKDRGLIAAGDVRIPNLIADGVVSHMAHLGQQAAPASDTTAGYGADAIGVVDHPAPQQGVEAVREKADAALAELGFNLASDLSAGHFGMPDAIQMIEALATRLAALRPSPDSGGSGFHSGPQARPSIPGGEASTTAAYRTGEP